MNSHEVFIHIHQGCFAGTGAIVRLPQCQWSKPDGYGKISQCITITKHSKSKTVCIFLGIYRSRGSQKTWNTPVITNMLTTRPIMTYLLKWGWHQLSDFTYRPYQHVESGHCFFFKPGKHFFQGLIFSLWLNTATGYELHCYCGHPLTQSSIEKGTFLSVMW